MAIYCPNCGKEHPDDANFCMKCGKPLTTIAQPTTAPKWEYCEVQLASRKGSKWGNWWNGDNHSYFYTIVTGPNGRYEGERSSEFREQNEVTSEEKDRLDAFTTKLSS